MTKENRSAADGEIIFARQGGLAKVTLNRPKALNALTQPMALALDDQLRAWQEDAAVLAVAIRGAAREEGRVPFCSGGDIRFLHEQQNDPDKQFAITFYEQEYRLNTLVFRFPKPYVALIDGVVMGGGVGISLPARYRVATENTKFAMPETGIGLFPDVGGGWYLSRLPGRMGQYIALTGHRLEGAECLALGLATHYLHADRLEEAKARVAESLRPDRAELPFQRSRRSLHQKVNFWNE